MRKLIVATVFGVIAALPASSLAMQTASAAKAPAKMTSKPATVNHVTEGTVKSIDTTSLVITKAGKKPEDLTFVINPSTQHQGTAETGSMVTVRYHKDGTTNVATAIVAHKPKSAKK